MVQLLQCLCPARHAIMATAHDPNGLAAVPEEHIMLGFREIVAEAIGAKKLNPWCALCGARDSTWTYESRRTRFETMEQARPELERLELQNEKAREMFIGARQAARN